MKLSRTTSLAFIVFLALLVAVLQSVAFSFFFYWTLWWYDILMHGLGGFLIGSIAAWAYVFELKRHVGVNRFLWIVGVTLAVGVLWEIFEYTVGFRVYDSLYEPYVVDTLNDMGMDTAGALLAFLMVRRFVAQT